MESLQRIADSNNHAVKLLASGAYRQAGHSFHRVIGQFLKQLPLDNQPKNPLSYETIKIEMVHCRRLSSLPSDCQNSTSEIVDHTGWGLCQRAFLVLPQQSSLAHSQELPPGDEMAVALLYNLALSHHMEATYSAHNRQKHLLDALRLYEMALAASDKIPKTTGPDTTVFSLAIFNNMIHIHSYFYNHEQTARCLDLLRHCLWISHQRQSLQQHRRPTSEMEIFYANLTISDCTKSLHAPAA